MSQKLGRKATAHLVRYIIIAGAIEFIGIGMIVAAAFLFGDSSATAEHTGEGSGLVLPVLFAVMLVMAVGLLVIVYGFISAKKVDAADKRGM